MVDARAAFPAESCVYVQAGANGVPVRVGMASEGLVARYRGGSAWALQAAAHDSGNVVFVAAVPKDLCALVEAILIWENRDALPYNNQGRQRPPPLKVEVVHHGDVPAGWRTVDNTSTTTPGPGLVVRSAHTTGVAGGHHVQVAGLDGCRGGWVLVTAAAAIDGPSSVERIEDLEVVIDALMAGELAAAAVDIPIGLPDVGARRCDLEARRLIGPRASSVFPAPLRPLLGSSTYEEAARRSQSICGKGLPKQAFAILPKIAQVDALMTPELQDQFIEVHPEVSFTVLTGRPMTHHKRSTEGRTERLQALRSEFPDIDDHAQRRLPGTAPDDVLDAYAAAWSARRWADGTFHRLGGETDGRGLRMEMIA